MAEHVDASTEPDGARDGERVLLEVLDGLAADRRRAGGAHVAQVEGHDHSLGGEQ